MDTNRVPQPRHDDDSVEGTTPASSAPTPAWTAGCSLAALSSPSATLMARSSSTSACRVAAARIADSSGPMRQVQACADLCTEWGTPPEGPPFSSRLLSFPLQALV